MHPQLAKEGSLAGMGEEYLFFGPGQANVEESTLFFLGGERTPLGSVREQIGLASNNEHNRKLESF